MKVSTVHMQIIAKAIEPLDTPERRRVYLSGDFLRADQVQDLNKRYRWDLFFAAGLGHLSFPDYKDAHIDTVLRRFVPPLRNPTCVCVEPKFMFNNVCRKCGLTMKVGSK